MAVLLGTDRSRTSVAPSGTRFSSLDLAGLLGGKVAIRPLVSRAIRYQLVVLRDADPLHLNSLATLLSKSLVCGPSILLGPDELIPI